MTYLTNGRRGWIMGLVLLVVVAAGLWLVLTIRPASADLQLLKQTATDPATFQGKGGYSADGLGQIGTGGTLQADVPAGSTVVQAYLYSTHFFQSTPIPLARRTVDFDGTTVVLTELTNAAPGPCCNLRSARADVTAQVATKVGGGGGITNFAVNTDPPNVDGYALVVIFSNAGLPFTTIAVLDGGAEQTGDTTTFYFASPLDKTVAGFSAIMSLGIGFSAQDLSGSGGSHLCGTQSGQDSQVDVNGQRLTSCAGNLDDGQGTVSNGILITVGGVGDNTNNPSDPLQEAADGKTPRVEDDELYNIASFLSQNDPQMVINTVNPSGDDIIFLAVVAITAKATVTTEICDDLIDNDGDGLIDAADPDCQVGPPAEPDIEKNLLEGPEVIKIYKSVATEYMIEIVYNGPAALVVDTIPAEFHNVTAVQSAGEAPQVFETGKSGKSATRIKWLVPEGESTLKVTFETRESPGKRNNKKEEDPVFKPTSCGPLPINDGATALEVDENGDLVLVPVLDENGDPVLDKNGNPAFEPVVIVGPSNSLSAEAVANLDKDKPCEDNNTR